MESEAQAACRKGRSGWFFLLLAFCLYFFFGISCILIVLISGLLGWLLCTWRVRKGGGMV